CRATNYEGSERFERGINRLPVAIIGGEKKFVRVQRSRHTNRHESIFVGIRQTSKQDTIDDAENGCCRSNAEGERANGCQREAWCSRKASQGVARVLNELLPECANVDASGVFLDESSIPELFMRFVAGFVACHTRAFIEFGSHLKMGFHLLTKVVIEIPPT